MPRPIPKVFLDANVLIAAGKPPGGPELIRVIDLVEAELISILATDLTVAEVAKKHVENDYNVIKDLGRPHFRSLVETVVGVKLPITDKLELREKLNEVYEASTKKMFKSLVAKILPIDAVKPSAVLAAYTAGEGFFNGEAKKDQFPDAFIFECLRNEASENSPIIIVSKDGDFTAAVKSEPYISLVKSLPDLFASLGLEMEAPEIDEFLEQNRDRLIEMVNEELTDWGLHGDVEDSEIDEITATDVEIASLTSFKPTKEGHPILVVGSLEVKAAISYTHPDWNTAAYDSEDKILIPFDTVSGETTVELTIDVSMSIEVDDSGKPEDIDSLYFRNGKFQYIELHRYGPYDYDDV